MTEWHKWGETEDLNQLRLVEETWELSWSGTWRRMWPPALRRIYVSQVKIFWKHAFNAHLPDLHQSDSFSSRHYGLGFVFSTVYSMDILFRINSIYTYSVLRLEISQDIFGENFFFQTSNFLNMSCVYFQETVDQTTLSFAGCHSLVNEIIKEMLVMLLLMAPSLTEG